MNRLLTSSAADVRITGGSSPNASGLFDRFPVQLHRGPTRLSRFAPRGSGSCHSVPNPRRARGPRGSLSQRLPVDASGAAIILLRSNSTVFTLDCSGSGPSEGEHVTLGWNEFNVWSRRSVNCWDCS